MSKSSTLPVVTKGQGLDVSFVVGDVGVLTKQGRGAGAGNCMSGLSGALGPLVIELEQVTYLQETLSIV